MSHRLLYDFLILLFCSESLLYEYIVQSSPMQVKDVNNQTNINEFNVTSFKCFVVYLMIVLLPQLESGGLLTEGILHVYAVKQHGQKTIFLQFIMPIQYFNYKLQLFH